MGECREAENSIMCKDFLRMGRSNFIVDPGVRLAYSAHESRQLYTAKVMDYPCSKGRGCRTPFICMPGHKTPWHHATHAKQYLKRHNVRYVILLPSFFGPEAWTDHSLWTLNERGTPPPTLGH